MERFEYTLDIHKDDWLISLKKVAEAVATHAYRSEGFSRLKSMPGDREMIMQVPVGPGERLLVFASPNVEGKFFFFLQGRRKFRIESFYDERKLWVETASKDNLAETIEAALQGESDEVRVTLPK